MLGGSTCVVSGALIGWNHADHTLIGLHPHYYTHPTICPDILSILCKADNVDFLNLSLSLKLTLYFLSFLVFIVFRIITRKKFLTLSHIEWFYIYDQTFSSNKVGQ